MQVLYKHVRGGRGPKEMLIFLMWLGGGGQRENAYVKDLSSANGF